MSEKGFRWQITFVASIDHCDFCVCTFKQSQEGDLHIERIVKDLGFWNNCVSKAHHFFKTCVLPELLGKWYTRSNKVYAVSFDAPSTSLACSEPSEPVY